MYVSSVPISLPVLFITPVKANVDVSHRLDELWILKISRLSGKYIDRSLSNPSGSMLKRCLLQRGHAFPLTPGLIRSPFVLPRFVPSSLASSLFKAPLTFASCIYRKPANLILILINEWHLIVAKIILKQNSDKSTKLGSNQREVVKHC